MSLWDLDWRFAFAVATACLVVQLLFVLVFNLSKRTWRQFLAYWNREEDKKNCSEIIVGVCEKKPNHKGKCVDETHEVVWR